MINAILFLGAPYTGKTTQARRLVGEHNWAYHAESSTLLRSYAAEHDDNLSQAIDEVLPPDGGLGSGALIPDDAVLHAITNQFERLQLGQDCYALLDGVIRTLPQAKIFSKLFDIAEVWYFDESCLTREDLVARMEGRGRKGEDVIIMEERLRLFHKKTADLITHYQDGPFFTIDPSLSKEEIYATLNRRLQQIREKRLYQQNYIDS